jgi:OOP family OmpA-OmpF porin
MKPISIIRNACLVAVLGAIVAPPLAAVEVVTEEDLVQGIIVGEQLVRVADNAVFLLDTSSSMNDEFRDTGKSKLELVSSLFKERTSYFPEIGHKFGIYTYTPWQEIYSIQTFDRQGVAEALKALPAKGSGPTPLAKGLSNAGEIIEPLTGRTALFLFYDGDYTGDDADPEIVKLVQNNDVCIYMISSAAEKENQQLKETIPSLNSCSRLIPLEYFLNRPEYTTGALFDVRATEQVVTATETRIVGLEVDNINFAFNKSELSDKDKSELDELGQFMQGKPGTYAVIAGYTDSVGIEDYNEGLSRRRTEMVASYLTDTHGIDETRLVLQWYGSDNPLTSNDTAEGRATNRRVEVAIGGL